MGNFICNECGAGIPPEWKGAISKNECPGCLGTIMSEEQRELIAELGEAMEKMPNDPIGVAGWLVSNYNLSKVGDCAPIDKFHDKGNRTVAKGPQQPQSEDKVSAFFKRGGYDVDKIKNAEIAKRKLLSNGGDITGTDLNDYVEEGEYVDDEDINPIDQVNSMLSGDMSSETAKARAFIEEKRNKQIEAQRNIASGVGATSRSGETSGFRRV